MLRHRACSRLSGGLIAALVLLIWFYGMPSAGPWAANRSNPTYSRTLVVARLEKDDVSWLEQFPATLSTAIYVVDNLLLSAEFRIPKNKGREAMVYLTYIIDHYDELADITLFTHPDLTTYHNNDLLGYNLLTMIESLSDPHVIRQGYFNLRCHHYPGCPDWVLLDHPNQPLAPGRTGEEQAFTVEIWNELHPGIPAPRVIAQPCCAQFAVTRERIQTNPRATYIRYRDWLLATSLEDTISGRIMEYSWQYIFTGVSNLCPEIHVCYCDGYGLCFGGAQPLHTWIHNWEQFQNLTQQAAQISKMPGRQGEAQELRMRADEIELELERSKAEAYEWGENPRLRAEEAGRPWKTGDGY